MKSLIASAVFFLTLAAHAFPAVGDHAVYNGVYVGADKTINYQQTFDVTGVTETADGKVWDVKSVLVIDGQAEEKMHKFNDADLLTNAAVQGILDNCVARYSGTLETLTIAGQSMQSCALVQSDGDKVWVAMVPFGLAKQVSTDEDGSITVEMESFTFGQ